MKDQPARILIIDDDDQSTSVLAASLSAADFEVAVAHGSRQALKLIQQATPDVIVLERFLERENALESCSHFRRTLPVPLMMLSRNGRETTVIESLDAGADDFVRKPVAEGEFLARIRALLRRSGSRAHGQVAFSVGALELDQGQRKVTVNGNAVPLTRTEFDILGCLMLSDGRTVGYGKLLEFVWGSTPNEGVRALRVHVAHLRKKIEVDPATPAFILTEPGVGYQFNSHSAEKSLAARNPAG